VCASLCGDKFSAPTGDFRTQALNGIEIVGAGVKSDCLASAE